jgi:hypothetical protein
VNFFSRALDKQPAWVRQLPPHVRPPQEQIRKIEAVRLEFCLGDQDVWTYLVGHPWTTRRTQRHIYGEMKGQAPGASEQDILQNLVLSRLDSAVATGGDLLGLARLLHDADALERRVRQIVEKHPDVETLLDAIIADELEQLPATPAIPGYEEACHRVDRILGTSFDGSK